MLEGQKRKERKGKTRERKVGELDGNNKSERTAEGEFCGLLSIKEGTERKQVWWYEG